MWRHYSGEVGKLIFLCEISSRYCTSKITEIDYVLTSYSKYEKGMFSETVLTVLQSVLYTKNAGLSILIALGIYDILL